MRRRTAGSDSRSSLLLLLLRPREEEEVSLARFWRLGMRLFAIAPLVLSLSLLHHQSLPPAHARDVLDVLEEPHAEPPGQRGEREVDVHSSLIRF